MAFSKDHVGYFPSTTGRGGFLTYMSYGDDVADYDSGFFLHDPIRDFVRSQGKHNGSGVYECPIHIFADNGTEYRAITVAADGSLSTSASANADTID